MLGEEARALEEADSGILRLPVGDPFPEEHFLLWLGVHALGFSMVCQADDNLLLAEGALRSLAAHCLESLRLLAPGSEVSLKTRGEGLQKQGDGGEKEGGNVLEGGCDKQ